MSQRRDWLMRVAVVLMRLYPKGFRAAYGREVEQAVRVQLAHARTSGGIRWWRVFVLLGALGGHGLLSWIDLVVRALQRTGRGAGRGWALDVRYVGRTLQQAPGYTAIVIGVLAVAVCVLTAAAGYVRGTLLRRATYADPDRIVLVWGSNAVRGQLRDVVSGPNFLDLRAATRKLTGLAAVHEDSGVLLEGDRPAVIDVLEVSVDFLAVLGVTPARGRDFNDRDRTSGSAAVALVSHGFWRDRLGGTEAVVGRVLRLSGESRTIVGVLPRSFEFLFPTTVLIPLAEDQLAAADRTTHHYWLFGRLAAGATAGETALELSATLTDIATRDVRMQGWSARVEPMEGISVAAVRPVLLALAAAVVLVLLAAAANAANLHAVRLLRRRSDWHVRHTLGAGPSALLRLLALETGVLILAGTLLGLLGAHLLLDVLMRVVPDAVPIPQSAAVVRVLQAARDAPVWLTGSAAGLCAGILFMLPGFFHIRRLIRKPVTLTGARVHAVPAGSRSLIVTELMLAMLLLVGAGLLLRSTARLLAVDAGLEPDHLLTFYVGDNDDADAATLTRYFRAVIQRIESVPGVQRAGAIDYVPFTGEDDFKGIRFEDRPPPLPGQGPREEWRRTSDGYFDAAGLTMLRGRGFVASDFERAPGVAVVNDAFARKHWPRINPVGQWLRVADPAYARLEVVGVVENVPERGPALPAPPMLYVPLHGNPRDNMAMFVRTRGEPVALLDAIRQATWSVDATQPIDRIATMRSLVAGSIAIPTLARTVIGVLALLALALAALGLVSIMSHIVGARRLELFVRQALGATPARLRRDLLAELAPLLALGLVLGAVAGTGAAFMARTLLHQVSPLDARTLLGAALVLTAGSTVAAWLPTRRI
jgi:predicted permease